MLSEYKPISRKDYPSKMDVTDIPALVCRDVKQTKRRFNVTNGSTFSTAGSEIRIPIAGNFVLITKMLI